MTESLEDTIARSIPYFEKEIRPCVMEGKRVLIAAHGNSLRALVMYIERLSEEKIVEINLPTGVPLLYELDDQFCLLKKVYLGDAGLIVQKLQTVANQGKAIPGV